jgi:hypothetical protein
VHHPPPGRIAIRPYGVFLYNLGVWGGTILRSYVTNPSHDSAPYISVDRNGRSDIEGEYGAHRRN